MVTAVQILLRGISQVFFLRSSPVGLLLVAGIALASPRTALFLLLGCAVQTLAAWICGPRELVVDGLMGYNGALVGAAASLSMIQVNATALSINLIVVGALACIPAHLVIRSLFESPVLRRFGLPVSTAPFCLVAGLLFGVLQPLIQPGSSTASPEPVQGAALGVANAFAEVMLSDGLLPGLVILIALLVGSWRFGLWGLLGAVAALVLGLLITQDMAPVSTGLLGYSAVLVAIALGAVFSPGRSLLQRLMVVLLGVAAAVGLRIILDPTPIPTYTWPFLLAMWAVLIGRGLLTRDPEGADHAAPAQGPRAAGADLA